MFGSDWPVCTLAASYAEVVALAAGRLPGSGRPNSTRCSARTRSRCTGCGSLGLWHERTGRTAAGPGEAPH